MAVKFYDPSKRGVGKFMRFDASSNLLISRTCWEEFFGPSIRYMRLGWDQEHRQLVIQLFEAAASKCLKVTTSKGGHKVSAHGFVREFGLEWLAGRRLESSLVKKDGQFVIVDCRAICTQVERKQ